MDAPSTDPLARTLAAIAGWGAAHAAAAIVGPDGVIAMHGDPERSYRWASITKLVTGLAVMTALDDGTITLDEPAPPPAPSGATVRHLLAHASGLPFDGEGLHGRPGTRRVYSNTGFDVLGDLLGQRDGTGPSAATALNVRVLDPLGMTATELRDRSSQGLRGPLRDLAAFSRELLRPTLVSPATFALATRVAFPALPGVLPGVGRCDVLDWGLAFELRDDKDPHWTGRTNSPATFGHFGGSGAFLWVDPELDRALVCLTDRDYGPWALDAWPGFSDAVIAAISAAGDRRPAAATRGAPTRPGTIAGAGPPRHAAGATGTDRGPGAPASGNSARPGRR
ncbi:serine hydrolase domain-containing protein [soil metagenome]